MPLSVLVLLLSHAKSTAYFSTGQTSSSRREKPHELAGSAFADLMVLTRLQNTRDCDRQRRATVAALTVPEQRILTRVSLTERQRIRRQAIAASTDPDVVAERDRSRERDRTHQRLRRQLAQTTADASHSIPPSNLLPIYQREALDNFMGRVFGVRSSLAQCETCLEHYHGIHMRGLQCDRCAHEVRSPPFVRPSAHWSQPGHHRYKAENEADPGLIPHELANILLNLTQMEEMLCSLASPCFLMSVSKGGQYKTRGNVITFSQDIAPLCTTLPRLPEQLDVLVVWKPGARNPATYKDFRVRKDKVLGWLYCGTRWWARAQAPSAWPWLARYTPVCPLPSAHGSHAA